MTVNYRAVLLLVGGVLGGCQSGEIVEQATAGNGAISQKSERRPICRALIPSGGWDKFKVPGRVGNYCLQQNVDSRRVLSSTSSSAAFERQCLTIIGGECRGLARLGLQSLSTLLYRSTVDGSSLDLIVMHFSSVAGSFAWFSGSDETFRRLPSNNSGPKGSSFTQINWGDWQSARRGKLVVRLLYTNETIGSVGASPRAKSALEQFSGEFLSSLAEARELPEAVVRLPVSHQVPGSASLQLGNALGVESIGDTAFASYYDGEKHWRMLAVVHPNADAARDVTDSMRKRRAAKPLRWAAHEAFRYTEQQPDGRSDVQWVIGRAANVIYGVADDLAQLPGRQFVGQGARVPLTTSQKQLLLNIAALRGK